MKITDRIKNAYSYGGIKEIGRKLFFYALYRYNGKKISDYVKKSKFEYGVTEEKRKQPIIVSMTTYYKRFPYIELCLKSLLLQDYKPDAIIVYLGADSDIDRLPQTLRKFENYGIEYRIDSSCDLKSYKKFFYAMQEYPNAVVVTVDDDRIYPKDWLRSLVKSYNKYPHAVSARRVHLMKIRDGKLQSYNTWTDQYRKLKKPSHMLFATGCDGVLYPPNALDKRAFDKDVFMDICGTADDVWLKFMCFLNDYPVVWVPNNAVNLPEIKSSPNTSLFSENVDKGRNDVCIKNVMKEYNISDIDLCK